MGSLTGREESVKEIPKREKACSYTFILWIVFLDAMHVSLTGLEDFDGARRLGGGETHSAGQFGEDGLQQGEVSTHQEVLLVRLGHRRPQLGLLGSPHA